MLWIEFRILGGSEQGRAGLPGHGFLEKNFELCFEGSRKWLALLCYFQEKAKQQGMIRGVIKQVAAEFFLEEGWEMMAVWNECGRNVSWWLIAWFKFHGARHPPWRPSFYTPCLIPGECHCHSEAGSVTPGPSQAKQHFSESGDSFIEPLPPIISSVFSYHRGCLSVRPVGRQGINISGCLPTGSGIRWPLRKAILEAFTCQYDARNSESLWCADLTEWAPMQLAWSCWTHATPWCGTFGHPRATPDRTPCLAPLGRDSGVRRAALETGSMIC